jgi:cytochrome c
MKLFSMTVIAVLGAALATSAYAGGNAANGATLFGRCEMCHANTKGAPNKIGPNLFGVVGRKAGTYPGFSYSAALKNSGIVWTDAKLDTWITSPAAMVPGTSMAFSGISNAGQRADIIAYLDTLK